MDGCNSCIWFVRHFTRHEGEDGKPYDAMDHRGECHRYPPQIVGKDVWDLVNLWPWVNAEDFCGEYQRSHQLQRPPTLYRPVVKQRVRHKP